MATIQRSLSSKVNANGKSEIMLRLSVSKNNKIRLKSGLFISPTRFKDGAFAKKNASPTTLEEIRNIEDKLISLERFLVGLGEQYPADDITKDFVMTKLALWKNPSTPESEVKEEPLRHFDSIFDEFLKVKSLSESRVNHYRVLQRTLHRFEMYVQITVDRNYRFSFDTCTTEDLYAFEEFFLSEHTIYDRYPEIYKDAPAITLKQHKSKQPLPRGRNYKIVVFKRFKALFNWCNKQGISSNTPFANFTIPQEKYGTPIFITDDDVRTLATYDFSGNKRLETQRDIFIFQCSIGCRVCDLLGMTTDNIIEGAIEYIADKTIEERPETIRVPLSASARAILAKYNDKRRDRKLFPFISEQKYNDAIKEMFEIAGITRLVTRLNPTTGEEEKVPINTIASSHMARRTFIGNLYNKVQDPNLIGSMSGHTEGSRAFARYRKIDDIRKQQVIDKIGF